jgi:hypothetical protein
MLDQSIDDPKVSYLNITPLPGYSNRFVSRRIPILVGTTFTVIGFRRPHNPICYGYEWQVILEAEKPLEGSDAEIHIRLDSATDPSLMVRR